MRAGPYTAEIMVHIPIRVCTFWIHYLRRKEENFALDIFTLAQGSMTYLLKYRRKLFFYVPNQYHRSVVKPTPIHLYLLSLSITLNLLCVRKNGRRFRYLVG